jgi:serine/threonine-protein kinase RsbW
MAPHEQSLSRAIRVKAETAQLAGVRSFVEEVASDAALDVERIFDLKVAVSEACANAVEHGGCEEALLEIDASLHERRLTFVVTDTGLFRPPCLPRQPHQSRGLGLPLMVALMDEVRFSRIPGGGTAVSLSVLI